MRHISRFQHASSRDLFIYWDQNRKGMKSLAREDLDPNEIRHILPDIFILDADHIEDATFRIAGSRVCAATCRELQGQKFFKDWDGEAKTKLFAALEAICNSGAVCSVTFYGISSADQRQEFEMLLLPLRANGSRQINRILGTMVATDTPYWLGMKPLVSRQIENIRILWPTSTVPAIHTTAPEHTSFQSRLTADVPQMGSIAYSNSKVLRSAKHLVLLEGGKA